METPVQEATIAQLALQDQLLAQQEHISQTGMLQTVTPNVLLVLSLTTAQLQH